MALANQKAVQLTNKLLAEMISDDRRLTEWSDVDGKSVWEESSQKVLENAEFHRRILLE